MKILIACEFSGVVRDAFAVLGHDAWSCDLLPTERPGKHFQQDIFSPDGAWNLPTDFDLMVAHPPCTHLACSGARWFDQKQVEERKAIWFFKALCNAPVPRRAIENPIGIMSTAFRKPDQIIQPWQFGEDASKATCLWLVGLPALKPTNVLPGGRTARRANQTASGQNRLGPSPTRAKDRARTYPGIAAAMAAQWG